MSENLLCLIPEQLDYIPIHEAQLAAEWFLKSHIGKTGEVSSELSEKIKFVNAGANSESIFCPLCGKEISGEWWSKAMDEAYKSQFGDLQVIAPCCRRETTLNQLDYISPQGFARFVLTVRNPGIPELGEQSISKLEQILGCKLRLIWSHF